MGQNDRIEEGHPLWEGLCKLWGSEGKPGQITVKGGRMYKVLLPEGEPVFVPVSSGIDNYYGGTSGVPGTGS